MRTTKTQIGPVYLVGAGPGDPGLLTLRGAELLRRAQVVIHDALIPRALLDLLPSGATVIEAGKRGGTPAPTQAEINRLLIEHARAGRVVVRLKGGDPFIFGRVGEEAEALAEAGLAFEIVPGVSSFSAAAGCAGIPLTHRAHASAFTVVSGHADPADPESAVDWARIAGVHGTKVVLMGGANLGEIAAALVSGGLAQSTPVALIRWGTTPAQRTLEGTLANIAARAASADFGPPAIAVIGEVVRLRAQLNWFERRPLFGARVVVPRSLETTGALLARLAELGAETIDLPTVRLQPPAERGPMIEALAGLGEYEWLLFPEAQAATAFFNALLAAYEDIRSVGNVRFAASPAAAVRLRELHLRVDTTPASFHGAALAQAVEEHESIENLRLLVVRGETPYADIVRELEDRGAIVDDVEFYRTTPDTDDPGGEATRLAKTGAEWIVFTEPASVAGLHVRLNLKQLVADHPALRLASIGPETSAALRGLGLAPAFEARPHTLDALVNGLIQSRTDRAG